MEWKKLLVWAMALGVLLAGCARVQVTPAGESLEPEGYYYALPRTVVTVEASLEKHIKTPGKYSCTQAAEDFISKRGYSPEALIKSPSEEIIIKPEGVKIDSTVEPDPTQVYHVSMSDNWYRDLDQSMNISSDGVIAGASVVSESRVPELAVTTLDLAASLVHTIFFGSEPLVKADSGADNFFGENDKSLAPKKVSEPEDPLEAEAQQIIQTIEKIDELRYKYLCDCGDKCAARVLDELKMLEASKKALIELIVGKEQILQHTLSFEVRPDRGQSAYRLFAVVEGSCGSPYILPLAPETLKNSIAPEILAPEQLGRESALQTYSLRIAPVDEAWLEKKGIDPDRKEMHGYYYRFPVAGLARVDLEERGAVTEIKRQQLPIAQFGVLTALPDRPGGVTAHYKVKYDQKTGAITEVVATNKGLSAEQAKNINAAAVKAIEAATPEKTDPKIQKLNDTLKYIKLQEEIAELEKNIKEYKEEGNKETE